MKTWKYLRENPDALLPADDDYMRLKIPHVLLIFLVVFFVIFDRAWVSGRRHQRRSLFGRRPGHAPSAQGCVVCKADHQAFAERLAIPASRIRVGKRSRPTMVLCYLSVAVRVCAPHLLQSRKCEPAASRVPCVDKGPDQPRQCIDYARLLWSRSRLRQTAGKSNTDSE